MTLIQRLLLLISAAVAVLLGAWLYEAARFHDAQEQAASAESARILSLLISEYRAATERVQDIASVAAIEAPNAAVHRIRCDALISSLTGLGSEWLRLDVLDNRGIVRCSTDPQAIGADLSEYPEILAARSGRHTRIADYTWDLLSHTPGLAIAVTWNGPDGTTGFVAAMARLDPLITTLSALLRKGDEVLLADRGGRILATAPQDRAMIGHGLPPPLEVLARMTKQGRIRAKWSDGSLRMIAYAPVTDQGVFIALVAGQDTRMARESGFPPASGLGLLFAAVSAIMLAWWGGVRFIRRPLRELTAVALRWRDGDQSARVTLPGRSEIAVLGRAFNTMADAKDQSDRQTREGVELLSSLIESSRDSIFVFDSSGRLLVANSTFLELIGLAHEEAIGRELMLALDPDLQRAFDDLRFQVITTRLPQASDIRARGPEQKQHVLQAICTPIFGEHATVRAVAGIGRDVTDVRETAECLQKARDQAEAADHAKTRFLAAASHDLRQPLQAAVMLADLLVERTGDSDPSIPEVRLCRSLGDLKRLVECLFDISRLDSGAIQPEFTNFPLQDLLDEVTISYAALAKEKGIALTVSRTSAVVRSDRILLGRVLSNLIDNAVKYTPAGNVKVECYPRNGVLQISIEDTGIGVSQQDQSRIWLEFEQLHNEQRDRRRGLGLGLAIVRRLSALLEHPMELESEPGQGSCFTITVPCIQTRPDMASDRCTTLHPGRCVAPGRAVIIDDDPMVLDVLRMTLEEHGWDVIAALDVAEVTNQLLSTEWIPDLVMVDYRLRDGQVGTDAIASVRKVLRKQLPAIILTGELPGAADQPDRPLLDARRIGAALVRKPVQSNELMELMNSVIAASRMSSPLDEAAT